MSCMHALCGLKFRRLICKRFAHFVFAIMAPHHFDVLSGDDLRTLLKKHLSSCYPGTTEFQDTLLRPLDDVVQLHEGFLRALVGSNLKMHKQDLIKQLKEVHKYPDAYSLEAFASKLIAAEMHCFAKSKQMKTGQKLATSVRRIAELYQQAPSPTAKSDTAAASAAEAKPEIIDESDEGDDWDVGKAEALWSDELSPVKRKLPTTAVAQSPGVFSVASSTEDHGGF